MKELFCPLGVFLPFSYISGHWNQVLHLQVWKCDSKDAANSASWKYSESTAHCCPNRHQASFPPVSSPTPGQHCFQKGGQMWPPGFSFGQEVAPIDLSLAWAQLICASFSYWAADCHNACRYWIIFENSATSLQIGWNQPTDSEVKGGVGEEWANDSGTQREKER